MAGRDRYLDLARGVAILLVCLLHAGALTPALDAHPLLQAVFDRMSAGMQLFFVLSGYLIARSWAGLAGHPRALSVFMAKRAAKILPLYLLVLHLNIALFLALRHLAPDLPPLKNSVSDDNLGLANYLAHWVFLQGVHPGWIHTLVDGSWSICVEVYFYLLFPLVLVRAGGSLSGRSAALVVACIAAEMAAYLLRKSEAGFGYYNFATQLPCLMMGALLYHAESETYITRRLQQHRSLILAACALLCLSLWRVRFVGVHLLYSGLFALAIGAAKTIPPRQLAGPAFDLLERIGQFSYALFFSHLILLKLQHLALRSLWPELPFTAFLAANLVTGVWLSAIVAAKWLHPIDRAVVETVRQRLTPSASEPEKQPASHG